MSANKGDFRGIRICYEDIRTTRSWQWLFRSLQYREVKWLTEVLLQFTAELPGTVRDCRRFCQGCTVRGHSKQIPRCLHNRILIIYSLPYKNAPLHYLPLCISVWLITTFIAKNNLNSRIQEYFSHESRYLSIVCRHALKRFASTWPHLTQPPLLPGYASTLRKQIS